MAITSWFRINDQLVMNIVHFLVIGLLSQVKCLLQFRNKSAYPSRS